MEITLEQAKVFDAVARLGTVQKVAHEFNKAHSAILYSLKGLEERIGVTLFDRSGYRNQITQEGEVVLKFCRQMLQIRSELEEVCQQIHSGWEPSLKLVYDGIVDFDLIGNALLRLNAMKAPTEIRVLSAYLDEVEIVFSEEKADIMVTILPMEKLQIPSIGLTPIQMHLVAHARHPLAQIDTLVAANHLNKHTFIKIKTGPTQIGLSTEQMRFASYFYVNDFPTKKAAILKQLGFGWLPDYLIKEELRSRVLRPLRTDIAASHTVYPKLYHRPKELVGKATRELLNFFEECLTSKSSKERPSP